VQTWVDTDDEIELSGLDLGFDGINLCQPKPALKIKASVNQSWL